MNQQEKKEFYSFNLCNQWTQSLIFTEIPEEKNVLKNANHSTKFSKNSMLVVFIMVADDATQWRQFGQVGFSSNQCLIQSKWKMCPQTENTTHSSPFFNSSKQIAHSLPTTEIQNPTTTSVIINTFCTILHRCFALYHTVPHIHNFVCIYINSFYNNFQLRQICFDITKIEKQKNYH